MDNFQLCLVNEDSCLILLSIVGKLAYKRHFEVRKAKYFQSRWLFTATLLSFIVGDVDRFQIEHKLLKLVGG